MKIINIIESLDDTYGGPAKSVPELCHYLNSLSIETEILSVKLEEKEANELVDKHNLKWLSFKYSFLKKLRISFELNNYLDNIAKKDSETILNTHNQWNYIPYLAFQKKKKHNIPLIATIRGSIFLDKMQKKLAWYLFQKKMLNSCDVVHVTKKSDVMDLRNMGIKSKIVYVPNGINLDEFQNMSAKKFSKKNLELEDRKYILFLGRVHQSKGLDYLVNSWIRLSSKYQNWDLLIVGPIYDKQYQNKILSKIESFGLKERVNFKGMLKGELKVDAFNSSDLFVLPSYSENFGMSIAEAMAAKIPVITTHGTPWQEIEEYDAGWWVALNQENIDNAVAEALASGEDELKQKGLNGFELIKKYEWKYQAKKMKEVYEWVLGGGEKLEFVYEVGDEV